jgi:hypothetical protein
MIRTSDFALPALGILAPPTRIAEASAATAWFDGDSAPAGLRIGCNVDAASRGLGVAEHTRRVLASLCSDDEPRR